MWPKIQNLILARFSGNFPEKSGKNPEKKSHKNSQKIPILAFIAVRFFQDFFRFFRNFPEFSGKNRKKIGEKIVQKWPKNTNFRYYSRSIFLRFFRKFQDFSGIFRKFSGKNRKKNRTKKAKKYQFWLL